MTKKKTVLLVIIALVVGITIGVVATLGVIYNTNVGAVWIGGGGEYDGAIYNKDGATFPDEEATFPDESGSLENGGAIYNDGD